MRERLLGQLPNVKPQFGQKPNLPAENHALPFPNGVRGVVMADRLDLENVRREYRIPEAKPFLMALLALFNGRMRKVAVYRQHGATSATALEGMIAFQAFVFMVTGGDGTRQAEVIGSFPDVPRRTIRDALARMVSAGLLERSTDGRYHPGKVVGDVYNRFWSEDMRQVERVAATYLDYQKAVGRITPS